jgi:hypothetical protein
MAELRVKLGFTNVTDSGVIDIGRAVVKGLDGNKDFPNPPVSVEDLRVAVEDFKQAVELRSLGGTLATAQKNARRKTLVKLLRLEGLYVEAHCDDDEAKLLSTGFTAKSHNRTRTPCPKAVIKRVDNGLATQLIVRVRAIENAQVYELRHALVGPDGSQGPWIETEKYSNSRAMPVEGLKPGSVYIFQVRAIGGSTRHGDWSDTVSHMSM